MTPERTMERLLRELAEHAPRSNMGDLERRLGCELAAVHGPGVTQLEAVGSTRSLPRRRWWLAAAVLLLVGLVGLDELGRSEPVVVAPVAPTGGGVMVLGTVWEWLESGEVEIVVWVDADATTQQLVEIEDLLGGSDLVDSYRLVTVEEIYEEFQSYWRDRPEIRNAVAPGDLPSRFDVTLRDQPGGAEVVRELLATAGVDDVGHPGALISLDSAAFNRDFDPANEVELRSVLPNPSNDSYEWSAAFEIDGLDAVNVGSHSSGSGPATSDGEQDWICRAFTGMSAIQCSGEPGPQGVQRNGSSAEIGAWIWTGLPAGTTAVGFADQDGRWFWQRPIDNTVLFADTAIGDDGQRCECTFVAFQGDVATQAWQW